MPADECCGTAVEASTAKLPESDRDGPLVLAVSKPTWRAWQPVRRYTVERASKAVAERLPRNPGSRREGFCRASTTGKCCSTRASRKKCNSRVLQGVGKSFKGGGTWGDWPHFRGLQGSEKSKLPKPELSLNPTP